MLGPEHSQWIILRTGRFSARLNRRVPHVCLSLTLVTLCAMVWSIGQGEYPISPLDVFRTILGLPTANADYSFIINTLRLPRTLVAWCVGMALGIAGTLSQGITGNPLAAPSIIGVNAGASLAAVGLLVLFPSVPVTVLPIAAFSGALVVAVLIYVFTRNSRRFSIQLILVGVGISLVASALTNLMITFGNIYDVSQALVWLVGSVYGRSWSQLFAFIPWLLIFGTFSFILSRDLNVIQMGNEVALSLGCRLEWQRGLLLLNTVALAGAAVATAGNIGFIGLMAPHMARQLVGPSHEGLLPTAALTGGMVVVIADIVGRLLFIPIEFPCGVVTAAVGAPYFLYLLIRDRT